LSDKFVLPQRHDFLWVTEFPLFTRADEEKAALMKGRWCSTHHPFTAPAWQDVEALRNGEIEHIRGQHYDLVLNGVEIGGGSVRIHDPDLQEYVFGHVLQVGPLSIVIAIYLSLVQLSATEREPFEPLMQALRSGAPPHGGIALGTRLVYAVDIPLLTI
jgi:aspartyl-tRNA synthetase